jgi:hypothetical protein
MVRRTMPVRRSKKYNKFGLGAYLTGASSYLLNSKSNR